jgi:uncharacterized damage-inducible protein DinB
MSLKAQYQTLFAYQAVTYDKLLACAASIDEAAYRQRIPYTPGSLHDMLFHILFWLHNWRDGVETNYSSPSLQVADFPTLTALRTGMQTEAVAWQKLLERLDEADFAQERNVGGSSFVLWRVLQHLVLHGMQHQAEAAAYLTSKGYSPGLIDFIWYVG